MAIVLHSLDQGLDRFVAIGVVLSAGHQAVRFVDEQDPVQRFVDFAIGFGSRLSGIFGDESRAVGFDQVPALQQSERPVDAAHDSRGGCLAGAGIPLKHHVQTQLVLGQAGRLTMLLQRQIVRKRRDLLLDTVQADQLLQVGQCLLDRVSTLEIDRRIGLC